MKYWLCFLLSLCCFAVIAGRDLPDRHRQTFENEKKSRGLAATKTPVILYHGGPVMVNKDLYVVYYGSFTATQHDILDNFLANLGGTGAYNVNSEYTDGSGNAVANILNYSATADSFNDAYSLGKTLSGSFDTTIIHNAIANGHLPNDPNGIYILTISTDVSLPRSVWCAYHTHSSAIVAGEDIKYAVAPDPPSGSLLNSCSGNIATFGDTTSPNGDIGMDAVADDLIHELSETATDPDLNAWFTKSGAENGDLCNFVYGTTFLAPNGSHANHVFGTRNYLVQTIWDRAGSFCALSH
jgi:hypothetical protein